MNPKRIMNYTHVGNMGIAMYIHGNSYVYTWQWLYIHAPCKPDSLPASTNYCLNTSRLSTIKRNEHYLLMQVLMGQYNFTHNNSHEAMLS